MSESFDRVVRAAARRGRAVGICPDADVLAAYLDNGLTSDERVSVETHAADCILCQQHLGLLGSVSIDPPPAEIEAARSWLARWGWLVPVATAVLLVAVWTRTPEPVSSPEPVVSQDQAAYQAPPPSSQGPVNPADANAELAARAKMDDPAVTAPAGEPQTTLAPARERRDVAAKAAPLSDPAPAAPPPAAAPPAALAEADRLGQLADAARAPAEVESKENAAGGARQEARLMRSATDLPVLQSAASSTEAYRAIGGRIERSRDGGTNWQEAFADASLTFTASACTPGGPCWFGTATGVVVRSSPNGFVRVPLPERLPVAAIAAGPGLEATVTAGGRQYRTTDGNRWVLTP